MVLSRVNNINILESIDIINGYLMEEDNVNIIYLDFCKGFDMVSHYDELQWKWKTLAFKKNSKYSKIILTELWK